MNATDTLDKALEELKKQYDIDMGRLISHMPFVRQVEPILTRLVEEEPELYITFELNAYAGLVIWIVRVQRISQVTKVLRQIRHIPGLRMQKPTKGQLHWYFSDESFTRVGVHVSLAADSDCRLVRVGETVVEYPTYKIVCETR